MLNILKEQLESSSNFFRVNIDYFEALYEKLKTKEQIDLVLNDGKNESNIYSFSSLDLSNEPVDFANYETLEDSTAALGNYELTICKMQAGLGTSVKRQDLILKYENREKLGAKGTDLFISKNGRMISIAQAQLEKAIELSAKSIYKKINYVDLYNEETKEALERNWQKDFQGKSLIKWFEGSKLERLESIEQLMMPTIKNGELTVERLAPAGHGFLGFYKLLKVFRENELKKELFVIGNGEDLQSTPDHKILNWMVRNELPIVMITTTKTENDKKGGQLALVKNDRPYVTIVEKAQAEKANQLELFEQLGLREKDNSSFFNTNIVLINTYALKKQLDQKLKSVNESSFKKIISPDLIKNVKKVNGIEYTQLEGAIGSCMLNLDKYFRQEFEQPLIGFLNLNSLESRLNFFRPIKKREDFDEIYK